jgi:hypothetical protein
VSYSGGDGLTGRVGGTAPGYDSQAHQRDSVRGFVCRCQSIKCPGRGSRYGGGELVGASSEADLTRGGVQPASEADLTRGGVQPSSEAEPYPRGRPALERGGVSLARRCAPSSEVEFRSRAAGPTVLVCRWGHQGRGPLPLGRDCFECVFRFVNSFAFRFFAKVDSLFLGTLMLSDRGNIQLPNSLPPTLIMHSPVSLFFGLAPLPVCGNRNELSTLRTVHWPKRTCHLASELPV